MAVAIYLAAVCALPICTGLAFLTFFKPLPADETSGAGVASSDQRPMTKLDRWRASKIEQQIEMLNRSRTSTLQLPAVAEYEVPPYAAMAKKAAKDRIEAKPRKRWDSVRSLPRTSVPTAGYSHTPVHAAADHQLGGR